MTRHNPTPEELHDWSRDRHGLDNPDRITWRDVAHFLTGTLAGGLAALLILAIGDVGGRPAACEGLVAAECGAAVEGR